MALSGTFSPLMAQMTTMVTLGSALASAHESLVLKPSVFPVSQPTEALASPGQGPSWESAGLQTSWSLEGRGWEWVRPGAPLSLLLFYQPHRRSQGHPGK